MGGDQARLGGMAPGDISYQPSSEPTHSSGKMSAMGHTPNPQGTSAPKTRYPEPFSRARGPRLPYSLMRQAGVEFSALGRLLDSGKR